MSRPTEAADSAGQPWKGRHFEANAHSADDGSAPEALLSALEAFAADGDPVGVVDAFRGSRFLIPLVAHAGEHGVTDAGLVVDKTQELSIVTVAGPDGRDVLPVFSSVAAMSAWNGTARPIPADGVRVALAAAEEGTDVVVVDPGSATEFALRRPALWAVAQSAPWTPPHLSEPVRAAFAASVSAEPAVVDVELRQGDPSARLAGPELVVRLSLVPGLDRAMLDGVLGRLSTRWAADEAIATGVDSMTVALAAAR